MLGNYLFIVFVLLVIGAFANWYIARKLPKHIREERWIKYFMYIVVLFVTSFCLAIPYLKLPHLLMAILTVRSVYELWHTITKLKSNLLMYAVVIIATMVLANLFILSCKDGNVLIFVYMFIIVFDGYSQIGGQLLKGPKLWSAISPGKTWSGLMIGIITACIAAILLQQQQVNATNSIQKNILLYAFCIAGCLFGDLFTSAIKRNADIKDFPLCLPGHGGVLDRYDSFFGCFAMLFIFQLVFKTII